MTDHPASALLTAWAAANADITNPTKDARGNYGSYLSLDQLLDTVRPIYTAHGLIWWQTVKCANGSIGITTHVAHTSGERLSFGTMTAPQPTNVQQIGSVRTYLSRYSYMTAMGLSGGDQDPDGIPNPKPKVKPQAEPQGESVKVQRKAETVDPVALVVDELGAEEIEAPISGQQLTKVQMGFTGIKVTSREDKLAFCADVIGHPIESSKDLTGWEADRVIAALADEKKKLAARR